jgi:pyruvate dehydrogenase E1 component
MAVQPIIPAEVDELEEIWEWIESFDAVVEQGGRELASKILEEIRNRALTCGVEVPFTANTPYVNTIHVSQQAPLPGDHILERKVKSLVRWNALAMVVRANRVEHNIGGHISTYGSVATLFEVGFNHFFRARNQDFEGDTVYLQGHAAPGVYARAFLEGRLTAQQLENFRRELKPGGGLSSYPHPWLMPDFW